MYVDSLALKNYRNYHDLDISFSNGINILYGDNAQGKTNIIEALYVASTTRSHRTSKDKELILLGEEQAHIRVGLMKRDVGHRIDMHIKKNKTKGVAIDSIPIRRSNELIGMLNVIFFSPEDLSIVKNGPVSRRRFMDMEISQISRIYYSDLQNYGKVLDQRNNCLRQAYYNNSLLDTLDVWDDQLVKFGVEIIKERSKFIENMNELIRDIHGKLTDGRETIELRYEPNASAGELESLLKNRRSYDIKNISTSVGPQRDDFGIYINGNDVRIYGSQGQQRTAALALKLTEIELVKSLIRDDPVLLLDDVLSELDAKRRSALIECIEGIQTIITCTGYDDFVKKRMNIDNIYRVEDGRVYVGK